MLAFTIADVPDDWEIELEQGFVDYLDRVNRPWKYRDMPRPWRATFCRAGETRRKYVKDPEQYLLEVGLFERLWGRHRYKDYHFKGEDPRRHVDTGTWIMKKQLDVIRKLGVTDEELEKHVTGLRVGKTAQRINRELHFNHLPVYPDKWWAWLLGLYFSAGTIYFRDRYYKHRGLIFRIRVANPVIPMVYEAAANIGSTILDYPPEYKPHRVATGLGTGRRPYVTLGWPVFLVLEKFGLPGDLQPEEYFGSGSRSHKPAVPSWIKENDEYMRYFIEAFINSSRGASYLFPAKDNGPVFRITITMTGKPEEHVKQFLMDVNGWFQSHGTPGHLRKTDYYLNDDPEMTHYLLEFYRMDMTEFFLSNFRIRKPELRARLTVMKAAMEDPVLYEALRTLSTPDNVILGMLIEKPLSKKEVENMLQMQSRGIDESVQRLLDLGLIFLDQEQYCYEPEPFRQSRGIQLDVEGHVRDVTPEERTLIEEEGR